MGASLERRTEIFFEHNNGWAINPLFGASIEDTGPSQSGLLVGCLCSVPARARNLDGVFGPGLTGVKGGLETAQVLGEAALGMSVDRATYQPNAAARKATAPGSDITPAVARGAGPALHHIGLETDAGHLQRSHNLVNEIRLLLPTASADQALESFRLQAWATRHA